MSGYCKTTPDAPNGNPSKLFRDLKEHLHDRVLAKRAWGFTKTKLFQSEFSDLEKDENGEPTYEALNRVLNLDSLISDVGKDINKAMDLGIVDENQNPVVYNDADVALAKASEYNQSATKKIAVVKEDENGGFRTSLEDNTPMAIALADRNESRRKINKGLIQALQKAGFNVEFTTDTSHYNVFDPLLADKNAVNLKTAIRVSLDKKGLDALPEEISHLVIAGLKNSTLRQRLDALCTDAVVREVLGDEYQYYKNKYKNGKMPVQERLREEAEGKILAAYLSGHALVKPNKNEILNVSRNEYTDEFRRLQERSLGLSEKEISRNHRGVLEKDVKRSDDFKRTLGSIYERLLAGGTSGSVGSRRVIAEKYNTEFELVPVNGTLFHDIFQVNRNYLKNGELVDLHDSYDDCKCFLTSDGLAGFAIEPNGNLVSVFSLNPSNRRGFLYAISDLVKAEGATHLDAYASGEQNLENIYKKTLRFQTASKMEYNEEYDHDDIAKNHNNPNVVFMVASDKKVEENLFDKNSYDQAVSNQLASISRGVTVDNSVPLIRRIWSKAKSMFAGMSEEEIDNIIVNANNAFQAISKLVQAGVIDAMLSEKDIMEHEKMYDLSREAEKLADIAQDGEVILSKKLSILQNTQAQHDTKELRNSISETRDLIENQRYAHACYKVLATINRDIAGLMHEADSMGSFYNNTSDLNLIEAESGLVERMGIAVQGYQKYLETLADLPVLIKTKQVEMDEEWAAPIVDMANKSLSNLRIVSKNIKELRFNVLKQLVALYYGGTESDAKKYESAALILQQAEKDISWWDTNIFSAGDSNNPLINVIHHIVVSQQAKRNNKINRLCARVQEAEKKLHDAGYSNEYVYQVGPDGVPTGYYVGPVDEARFQRDREAFIESLDTESMDYYEIQHAIEKWDNEHLEPWEVGEPITVDGKRRIEYHPKLELYSTGDFQKGWSQVQKDYYNALMDMKAELDAYLPVSMQNQLLAPQVRKSVTQMFDKGGRGAFGTIWNKWKQEYSIVDDNDEYGKNIVITGKDGRKKILLDFAGKPVKRVPIYFIHKMDDMRDLSTDATHSMFNYIAMAVNYSEMGQLANAMRLMQQHVQEDYEVIQTDGGRRLVDMFRSLGREYEKDYVKTGSDTNVVRAIVDYIDRQFFNETKIKMGDMKITEEKSINKDATFNIFMKLTSISRMGINVLSAITNATQGETQMICEAIAKRYFNMKDLGWSKAEYAKLLKDYLINFNSHDRHDKMYMLINQFNSSEDFFRDMKDVDFNKSAFKRVLGRGNIYFLNTMGEHYLHTAGMLAILNHEKVRRIDKNGNASGEVSLYDTIKQVHDKNGWHLELDSDIEFMNKDRTFLNNFGFGDKAIVKQSDRDKLFENLSIYINKINAGMHGGYSEAEKGNANRQALWRAILQFRQWMPGMYNKMYTNKHYDPILGKDVEGSYQTVFNFIMGTIHDMKNMSLKLAIENNNLSPEERQNARVAIAQSALFVFLSIAAAMTKGWKDKDDRNIRLLAYQMRRLEMETGALVPFPPTFIKNVFTLVQSPAAGIKTLENVMQVFDLASIFQEVQSGRFKGWWKPAKAIWVSTPLYNIQRLVDMDDYNYMFNIFN